MPDKENTDRSPDREIQERVAQSRQVRDVEKLLKDKKDVHEGKVAAENAAPVEVEELMYIKVESLDELKARVRRVCDHIDQKEDDIYNKRRFPYRLAAIFGSAVFFLSLVISFLSELSPRIVVKRSISSFFLFAFLGWLAGLLINYFSPRTEPQPPEGSEPGVGGNLDVTTDIEKEFGDFIKGKERVADPRAPEPGTDPDSNPKEEPEEETKEDIQAVIEKVAKEEPEKMAQVIKGVLTRDSM